MEENETSPYLRDVIAKMILISTLGIIVYLVHYWINALPKEPQDLFNIILPLISTWVGTILAFYFGKANFEAATKSYKQVIEKLSPEVLDDVLVKQVMIDKFTMVSIDVNNNLITNFNLEDIKAFLDSIDKSRLPILADGKVKCIIRESTINAELLKTTPAATLQTFIDANQSLIEFDNINEDKKVEDARKIMKDKNYKDLFVIDAKGTLVGWLTDTQIMRYLNNQ